MKVFISWSGEESKQIALALRDWLPMVLNSARCYMSERDNAAGTVWSNVLFDQLESTDFGILCLTPSNLQSPWLHFEAGAIGKAVAVARVVPLLHRVKNADVAQPLGRYMMRPLDQGGVLELLKAIHGHLPEEHRPPEPSMKTAYEALWPELKEKISGIEPDDSRANAVDRSEREILEEILSLVRQPGIQGAGDVGIALEVDPAYRLPRRMRESRTRLAPFAQVLGARIEGRTLIIAVDGEPSPELTAVLLAERERLQRFNGQLHVVNQREAMLDT